MSNALGKHPNVFSTLYVSMVKAGEMGGVLDEVLERLASFMEKDFSLKKKVKSALTYPVVILIMALCIVFFLVTYILPTFVSLFEGMNLQLPLPTKILIAVTKGARDIRIIIPALFLFVACGVGVNRYISTPVGKRQYDLLKLKHPHLWPAEQEGRYLPLLPNPGYAAVFGCAHHAGSGDRGQGLW